MKPFVKKYAGALLAGTIVIGGIASAAVTPNSHYFQYLCRSRASNQIS